MLFLGGDGPGHLLAAHFGSWTYAGNFLTFLFLDGSINKEVFLGKWSTNLMRKHRFPCLAYRTLPDHDH